MIKRDLSQGCKYGSISANQCDTTHKLKNKNHINISIDADKVSDKIQHLFIIKTRNKVGVENTYLNIINVIYDEPTTNIILKGENLKAFPL